MQGRWRPTSAVCQLDRARASCRFSHLRDAPKAMAGGQNVARRYGPNSASRGRPARGVVCYGCSAKLINWATRNWLPPARVLAIVLLLKDGFDPLLAPDFVSSSPGCSRKVRFRSAKCASIANLHPSTDPYLLLCRIALAIELQRWSYHQSGHPFLFQKNHSL